MFNTSNLFFPIGGMSCDSGLLDLIFAFKELWGLLWEPGKSAMVTVREVLPAEESPGCYSSRGVGPNEVLEEGRGECQGVPQRP